MSSTPSRTSRQFFQQRVGAGLVQFGHDVGNRLANSGELAKPVLGGNPVERLDERREGVRSAQVGFGGSSARVDPDVEVWTLSGVVQSRSLLLTQQYG
jgi:hypothetical protein